MSSSTLNKPVVDACRWLGGRGLNLSLRLVEFSFVKKIGTEEGEGANEEEGFLRGPTTNICVSDVVELQLK
tara:strand:- start:167 stop:379 length:213 start_codon:yes stop_codon:yes gene_type:complete